MDGVTKKRDRFVHRLQRAPVLGSNNEPIILTNKKLRPVHLDTLEILSKPEHPVLSISHIAALQSRSYDRIADVTKLLRSPGNDYIEIVEKQRLHPNQFRTTNTYFQLTEKGDAALYQYRNIKAHRLMKSIEWLEHKTAEAESMANFKIGAIQHPDDIAYIDRAGVLDSRRLPQKTRDATSPETIALPTKKSIRPDGTFFVLNFLKHDDYAFCPGIEMETGKNPADRLHRKLSNYLSFLEHELYHKHFGVDNAYIPFIFASRYKLEVAMDDWERLTAQKRRFRRYVLFQETVTYETGRPMGTDQMVSKDWLRVGMEPLNFLKYQL